jgi:hypothetical protein
VRWGVAGNIVIACGVLTIPYGRRMAPAIAYLGDFFFSAGAGRWSA